MTKRGAWARGLVAVAIAIVSGFVLSDRGMQAMTLAFVLTTLFEMEAE